MTDLNQSFERTIVQRIRQGDAEEWKRFIDKYEGRLQAYVSKRLQNSTEAEDVVQETFIGFLNSLANYDCESAIESYLFAIASYKVADVFRKKGRSAVRSAAGSFDTESAEPTIQSPVRAVSSIARSMEERKLEENALAASIKQQLEKWKRSEDWNKLKCLELLFVSNRTNKEIAALLPLTEQQVANYKSDFLDRTRKLVLRNG